MGSRGGGSRPKAEAARRHRQRPLSARSERDLKLVADAAGAQLGVVTAEGLDQVAALPVAQLELKALALSVPRGPKAVWWAISEADRSSTRGKSWCGALAASRRGAGADVGTAKQPSRAAPYMLEDSSTWRNSGSGSGMNSSRMSKLHLRAPHRRVGDLGRASRPHRSLPLGPERRSGSCRERSAA